MKKTQQPGTQQPETHQPETQQPASRRDILELEEFLPYRLSVLAQALSREIEERHRKRHGLAMKDWKVMQVLALHGAMQPAEISRVGTQNKAQVSRALKCLLDRGIVEKRPLPDDNRTFTVSMTEAGWKIYEAVVPLMRRRQAEIVDSLPGADLDDLRRLLGRLEEALRVERSPAGRAGDGGNCI